MTAAHTITTTRSTPRLYARQRQLLQLLDALGGTADKLDFQNLLFRYCQEPLDNAPYQFVPYQHGAFSFTADADCQKLVAFGLLADRGGWHLTDQGRTAIGRTTEEQLSAFVCRHRLRGDALVADTYRCFPFYATRSEHAERLLQGDGEALARIEAVRATRFDAALHTIGYEGHSVESYLNALLQNGITILCDVRRNPISRKYGFSKGTLSQTCENVGIQYAHLPELGIASQQRKNLDTQDDYDALFDDYERTWLPKQGAALAKIQRWLSSGERVTLTCYEHLPQQCHRHCVAEAIEEHSGQHLSAKHL